MNPAKILIGVCLLMIGQIAFGQHIYKIKTDSLLVTNDSCNAELNLENSTRNVNGFLYNKGNGRTEFRKALVQLPDGHYLIGGDTLNVKAGIDSGYIWNQYAQKQTARAWIDSMRLSKTIYQGLDSTGANILAVYLNSKGDTLFHIKSGYFKPYLPSLYFGYNAGYKYGTAGVENVGIGTNALSANNAWGFNTAVGAYALDSMYNGGEHTAIGYKTLHRYNQNNGFGNTALGSMALMTLTSGSYNTALGNHCGTNFTTGNDNIFIGQAGAYGIISGNYNVVIGDNTIEYNAPTNMNYNTIVGFGAGRNSTGSNNTLLGEYAGRYATGSGNIFLGLQAGYNEAGSNKLYISNSSTPIPLVYGEFDNQRAVINGSLSINDTSRLNQNANKLYVNGSSKFAGNIYQNSGYRTLLNGAIDDSSTALQVNGSVLAQGFAYKNGSVVNFYQPCQWWRSGGRFMGWVIDYNGTVAGGKAEMNLWTTGSTMVLERYYNDAGDWHINASQHGNLVFNVWPSYYIKLNAPRVQLTGVLNLPASTAPTSSTDSSGSDGDLKRDANGNVYLKANGQWSTLLNTQAQIESPVVILKTLSVSNATSFDVDLTNYYTAYDRIDLDFSNVRPTTDNVSFQLYVSSDGVNFDNGTNNYKYSSNFSISNGSYGPHVSQGDTRINLGDMVGNSSTGYFSGTLTLTDPDNSSVNPFIRIQIGYTSYQGDIITNVGWGRRLASQATKKIRIQPTSGNISGTVKIIGYK